MILFKTRIMNQQGKKESFWKYPTMILLKITLLIYLVITLVSTVEGFINANIKWYYPLIPLLIFLLNKQAHRKYMNSFMATEIPSLKKEYANDPRYNDAISEVYKDLAGAHGIVFKEMFQGPVNLNEKVLYLIQASFILMQIVVVVLFSVLAKISWLKLLIVYFIAHIIILSINRL